MRDAGVAARRIPELGLERVEALRNAWLALPESLREQGQRSPELDYGLERLSGLQRRLSP
jgi:hypothetical protein